MRHEVAKALKQRRKFDSIDQEVVLSLRMLANRILEPWEKFLKAEADLSVSQFNVLRILRGSHPERLPSSEIGTRMVARDPDVTRLVDRLSTRGLVVRERSASDRRVVEVGITDAGLALLAQLDPHAKRMPKALVGGLGKTKLIALRALLDELLQKFGTFP
ncbi:MAG: MarR family transcriptional regulator [Gemmatimonadaceae bacterium]|nr:MarR family transcriptional regulator [Gemmatimonadaceae bacterium]